jgi:hypothetical protein
MPTQHTDTQAISTAQVIEMKGTQMQSDTQAQYEEMVSGITYEMAMEMSMSDLLAYANIAGMYVADGQYFARLQAIKELRHAQDKKARLVKEYEYTRQWLAYVDTQTQGNGFSDASLQAKYKRMSANAEYCEKEMYAISLLVNSLTTQAYELWHTQADTYIDDVCSLCMMPTHNDTQYCDDCAREIADDDIADDDIASCQHELAMAYDESLKASIQASRVAWQEMKESIHREKVNGDNADLVAQIRALTQSIALSNLPLQVISTYTQALATLNEYTQE